MRDEYRNMYEKTKKELNDYKKRNEDLEAKCKENKELLDSMQKLKKYNQDLKEKLCERNKEYDVLMTERNQGIASQRMRGQVCYFGVHLYTYIYLCKCFPFRRYVKTACEHVYSFNYSSFGNVMIKKQSLMRIILTFGFQIVCFIP